MGERGRADKGVLLERSLNRERKEKDRKERVSNMNRASILCPAPHTNKASQPNHGALVQREVGHAAAARTFMKTAATETTSGELLIRLDAGLLLETS